VQTEKKNKYRTLGWQQKAGGLKKLSADKALLKK
jgi:hypothetical protein